MPPKKSFSFEELQNPGAGKKKPHHNNNNNNNKGFYTGGDNQNKNQNEKSNSNFSHEKNNSNYNNNYNNKKNYSSPQDRSRQGYNDKASGSSQHIPYWPVSLVNAYTMPFSIPLPVHLTKTDIPREFSTNFQEKTKKSQDKAREKGINPNYKGAGGGFQDNQIGPADNDNELVIDTKMRHLYQYGLQSMLESEYASLVGNNNSGLSLMNSPVPEDKKGGKSGKGGKNSTKHDAKNQSSLDSTHKIQIPAYSEMLPDTPYQQLALLHDKVYDTEDPELEDYIDSGFYSTVGKKLTKKTKIIAKIEPKSC